MRTVVGVFQSIGEAERAKYDLERLGLPDKGMSLVSGNDPAKHDEYLEKARQATTTTAAAAASGASLGGGIGWVAGFIALVIPGVGPILAGGAFATLLTGLGIGALSGGLIGAFEEMGLSHDEAPIYEEAVRRGAVMLAVQVDDEREAEVVDVFHLHGARDLRDQVDTWRAQGWRGPHKDPHPYVYESDIRNYEDPETEPPPMEW